jgi:hypothetical protein
MTIRFTGVETGETFKVNVWRKNLPGAEGHLLASLAGTTFSNYQVLETNEQGWEHLELSIYLNNNPAGSELIVYLHNPANTAAYFDNLEITRYQSIFNK